MCGEDVFMVGNFCGWSDWYLMSVAAATRRKERMREVDFVSSAAGSPLPRVQSRHAHCAYRKYERR
jgi:hypothetical protein